jgi:hypothetical protein
MVAEEPILAIGFVMIGIFYYAHTLREKDEALAFVLRVVGFVSTWFIIGASGVSTGIIVFYVVTTIIFLIVQLILLLIDKTLMEIIKNKFGTSKGEWSSDV